MEPVSFQKYGNELRETGIYAFAMERYSTGKFGYPEGYTKLSSYQEETTPDLLSFFPNPAWEPTDRRDPDVALAVV